jgi:starvation-inducible DNA-binding protein
MPESLLVLFADVFAFSLLAKNSHWNNEGQMFYEHHLLYDRVYEESYANVDRIAEYIRGWGVRAPASLPLLAELTTIPVVTGTLEPEAYLRVVLAGNDLVLKTLKEVNTALLTNPDPRALGGLNIVGDVSETHCSLGFLLSSSLY